MATKEEKKLKKQKKDILDLVINKNFDWSFLLRIEQIKFRNMLKFFEKATVVDSSVIVRDLKLELKLIDIILEEDWAIDIDNSQTEDKKENAGPLDWEILKYVNTKNADRFFKNREHPFFRVQFGDIKPGEVVRGDKASWLQELRIEKAWKLYHKIKYDKMRTWWE